MVQSKLIGTFKLAILEAQSPKVVYFVKNSGDLSFGFDGSKFVVSSDTNLLKDFKNMQPVPDN